MPDDMIFPGACYNTTLRKATRAVTRLYDTFIEPSGIKTTQYSLLNYLQGLGPVTMNTLSSAIKLERSTLVRNIDILLRDGYAEIIPGPPPKANTVKITPKGEATLATARPLWEEAQKAVELVLSDEEQVLLRKLLKKLRSLKS